MQFRTKSFSKNEYVCLPSIFIIKKGKKIGDGNEEERKSQTTGKEIKR